MLPSRTWLLLARSPVTRGPAYSGISIWSGNGSWDIVYVPITSQEIVDWKQKVNNMSSETVTYALSKDRKCIVVESAWEHRGVPHFTKEAYVVSDKREHGLIVVGYYDFDCSVIRAYTWKDKEWIPAWRYADRDGIDYKDDDQYALEFKKILDEEFRIEER